MERALPSKLLTARLSSVTSKGTMAGTPQKTSLLGELKRHQVFKVGATYSVVAFVVIQVKDMDRRCSKLRSISGSASKTARWICSSRQPMFERPTSFGSA